MPALLTPVEPFVDLPQLAPYRRLKASATCRTGCETKRGLSITKYGQLHKLPGQERELLHILVVTKAQSESLCVQGLVAYLHDSCDAGEKNIIHSIIHWQHLNHAIVLFLLLRPLLAYPSSPGIPLCIARIQHSQPCRLACNTAR